MNETIDENEIFPDRPARARNQSRILDRSSLVLIRTGLLQTGEPAPLFITPGIGGVAIELFRLGKSLRYPGAVYANEFRGVDGRQAPHRSLADIADFQVAAIRQAQSHGPYHLMGYSFGGLVAFEIARRLLAAGEPVAFLGLLEPLIHRRHWPIAVRMRFAAGRLHEHRVILRDIPRSERPAYLLKHAPLLARFRRSFGEPAAVVSASADVGVPRALINVRKANEEALYGYRIQRLDCHATFFRSANGNRESYDSVALFGPYVTSFDIRSVGGDHLTMLRPPHVQELGRQVDGALSDGPVTPLTEWVAMGQPAMGVPIG